MNMIVDQQFKKYTETTFASSSKMLLRKRKTMAIAKFFALHENARNFRRFVQKQRREGE